MFAVPAATVSTKMPNRNGTSPVFVTMNALIPASEFTFSSHQWPISRYEQIPTSSQPIRSSNSWSAITSSSIDAVNRDRNA